MSEINTCRTSHNTLGQGELIQTMASPQMSPEGGFWSSYVAEVFATAASLPSCNGHKTEYDERCNACFAVVVDALEVRCTCVKSAVFQKT